MERDTSQAQSTPRPRRGYAALVAAASALVLTYGVARQLAQGASQSPGPQHFTVHVDRGQAPWERPVLAIREGMPAHISVHSQEPGVLMVHEIPGAFAACAGGGAQSLDLLPMGVTGRFSLHFHSQADDQIEVATIEIYPR